MDYNLKSKFDMHYWDFVSAIELDLKTMSRYIEFSDENDGTYSIELVRLYLSTCSEIEVVLKQMCKLFDKDSNPENINGYRKIIKTHIPQILDEVVNISFKKTLKPWVDWNDEINPKWWKDYQLVKHKRNENYHLANLNNVLHAVSALFICVHFYYLNFFNILLLEKMKVDLDELDLNRSRIEMKDITQIFNSGNNFLKLAPINYKRFLQVN